MALAVHENVKRLAVDVDLLAAKGDEALAMFRVADFHVQWRRSWDSGLFREHEAWAGLVENDSFELVREKRLNLAIIFLRFLELLSAD